MVTFKTRETLATGAGHKMPWKLILAACAFGTVALGIAWATPPFGLTLTPLAGPAVMGEVRTVHQTPDWGVMLKTRGLSDVYVTHIKVPPGGHGGWHSHPGPSIISVRAGTATFYDECNDFLREQYPAGTGFVKDAGCAQLLANEGNVDLEVIVVHIVPKGAPRRIDEPAPY